MLPYPENFQGCTISIFPFFEPDTVAKERVSRAGPEKPSDERIRH